MPRDSYYLPTRRLVSQEDTAIIERPQVPRSRFEGQWTRKTTFDAGYLVPILVDEVLPGDHLSYNVTAYIRMSTPLFPLFDNQRVDTFFFYVPNRILWENWARFMGEQANPADSIDYAVPTMEAPIAGYAVGSVMDHMGLPIIAATYDHSTLPLRAYNRIYNDWFRDQNLINSAVVAVGDTGVDGVADFPLRRRCKAHDYFTSALPWPQKFTAPSVPLVGDAPIVGLGTSTNVGTVQAGLLTYETDQSLARAYPFYQLDAGQFMMEMTAAADARPAIYADLAQVSGVAINTFRQAFLVQQLLERDARGGTRYVEKIRAHFGVTSPDFRLQRPEYIGGGSSPMQITPVAQTAPTDDLPVGALGAASTAVGQHRASFAATEHGYIIGLINVRTELSYQQGLARHWSRLTQYDFYVPSLAGLGEQAILRKEIYCTGTPSNDDAVFGYQERWHEYRTRTSEITSHMRSEAPTSLDAWHLGQFFASAPLLGLAFIQDTPPMDRVLAAAELAVGQQYLADILIQRTAVRPIPTFGTPVTLGRF